MFSGRSTKTLDHRGQGREWSMLYYALLFLIVGIVAAVLGASGVAAVATQISWVLFVVGMLLLLVHLLRGRTPPVT